MEKFYINARLHKKGNLLSGWTTIPLPTPKQEIEETAKLLGYSDLENAHFQYETNLPKEFTNYIDYRCFITENNGYTTINSDKIYTSYERLKVYNTLALCLNDLYNSDYCEDLITKFISVYAEHAAVIIADESFKYYYIEGYDEDEDYDEEEEYDEEGYNFSDKKEAYKSYLVSMALLTKGTANFLDSRIGFFDYNNIDGDIYTLAAWDIDEYEGETIDDYDDDPYAYLEAICDSYELYINEDERYVIDLYYTSKEVTEKYEKELEKRLVELGY